MIAGCYSLHLYCDNYTIESVQRGEHEFEEFPHEYTDELGSKCRAEARRDGWKFNWKHGAAICPKCNRRKLK
jgi:hypothetical protein